MFKNLRTLSVFSHISIMIVTILSSFVQPPLAGAKIYNPPIKQDVEENKNVSPSGHLNPDGTLKLDGSFSGSFDLQGWNVQMDPSHGPIFQPDSAPSATPLGQWESLGGGVPASPNSFVRAVAISGTDVYIGGSFSNLNNMDTLDSIAKWNGTNWSALGSNGAGNGSLNGVVDKIVISGTNVYVAGSFSDVNNNGTVLGAADYIARWNGTNWSALGSDGFGNGSINAQINALAVSGSNVYVGGQFTDVKNSGLILTAADYVARWDGTNWSALGSNGAANGSLASAQVYAIAISGSNIYVGGQFTNLNNNGTVLNAADYIAKWDGTNWSALSSNGASDGSLNNYVRAIAVSGSNVYIGGNFFDVNNNGTVLGAADYLTMWDGTNWSALASNGSGGGSLTSQVLGLTVSGTDLYVGGIFGNVNNNGTVLGAADYIAKWDGSNWSALGSNGAGNGSLNYYLSAIAVSGANIYIGGFFSNVNNNGTNTGLSYLALFNGTDWGPVDATLQGAIQSTVSTVAVNGTNVYVGGGFTNAANIPEADYIAKWNGTNWSALSSNGSGDGAISNAYVADIAVSGSNVYVGGNFGYINDNGNFLNAADNIAKWDGSNWSALGSNGAGDGSINSNVHTLTVSGSNVYVGGLFENVNNNGTVLTAADYLAKWDGTNWSALGSNGAGDGALNFWVDGIAVSGTNLYVIGAFTNVNNNGTVLTAADYLAKWDGTNWSALSSNGAGESSFNGSINAIAISGSNLYIGGNFAWISDNGTPVSSSGYIARWDGTHWFALGSDGAGGSALNGQVNSIVISGNEVYAGGQFSNVNNSGTVLTAADYIAKWDGTNWSALGSNGGNNGAIPTSPSNQVRALAVGNESLYVGGSFFNVSNNGTPLPYADHIAAYGIPNNDASVAVSIGGIPQGTYTIVKGDKLLQTYAGTSGGPVLIDSTNDVPVVSSLRLLYNNKTFSELMGVPTSSLSNDYWLPYYANIPGTDTQIRFTNTNNALSTTVNVYLGNNPTAVYTKVLAPSSADRFNLPSGTMGGPVHIVGTGGVNILAGMRVIYGGNSSFDELMAYPSAQLDTEYWFPFYNHNNVNLDTEVRVANTSSTTPAPVSIYIGDTLMDTTTIAPLTAYLKKFPGVNGGPLRVVSTSVTPIPVVASLRLLYNKKTFSELMGVPTSQLSNDYWLPYYANIPGTDTQIRFTNTDDTLSTTVDVYLGNNPIPVYSSDLLPKTADRFNLPSGTTGGPVHIVSSQSVNILAGMRVIYGGNSSFDELMAYPTPLLSAEYWFPFYNHNNVNLDTELRIGTP